MEAEGVEGIDEACLCGTKWGEKVDLPRDLQRVASRAENPYALPGPEEPRTVNVDIGPGANAVVAGCRDTTVVTLGARELFAAVWMLSAGVSNESEERGDIARAFDFADKCVAEARREAHRLPEGPYTHEEPRPPGVSDLDGKSGDTWRDTSCGDVYVFDPHGLPPAWLLARRGDTDGG
jgi:hypothetical protein